MTNVRRHELLNLGCNNGSNANCLEPGLGICSAQVMTLDDLSAKIRICAIEMDKRYGGIVFDEWAIVSLAENKARILFYTGPRNDDFLKHFVADLGSLRTELHNAKYGVGDFEFSRHAVGTHIEAFMVLGGGNYLIANNTQLAMENITKNSRWLEAQVPFVELSESVQASPLLITWDTRFFLK